MIVLSCKDLTKTYGTEVIIENVSFSINDGDRVGIVGRNGVGKTTLLNMLTGEMEWSSGDVFIQSGKKLGYLKQRENFEGSKTINEVVLDIFSDVIQIEEKIEEITKEIDLGKSELVNTLVGLQDKFEKLNGYQFRKEIDKILFAFEFYEEDREKLISQLSGGERTRLALACLLLEKPDILLLDEPTNHLDLKTLSELEKYLAGYKGSIIVVSHDRYFLDKVTNRTFEIRNHHLDIYEGSYSFYVEEKEKRRQAYIKAYQNQQREIKRQEEIIRVMMEHNTEHLVKRAQSREKRLKMLDVIEAPESEMRKLKLNFTEDFKSGNDVLYLENVSKSINGKELFSDVNIDIKRGEKICIVGQNGIGKTTFIKSILSNSFDSGYMRIGHNVMFGYYDQGQLLLNPENTLLEELKNEYTMYSDTEMRKILGAFLFTGDDVFLKIKSLSGGEKARLSLVKLILSGANTLILDEPTNHLDIDSKEAFEDALLSFPGTTIIVSHDRYFLKKIPDRIVELTEDGFVTYLGNYDYYIEKKVDKIENIKVEKKVTSASEERRLGKEKEALIRRRKRELETVEADIALLEDKKKKIEKDLNNPNIMSDFEKLGKLSIDLQAVKDDLDMLYLRWEELSEE